MYIIEIGCITEQLKHILDTDVYITLKLNLVEKGKIHSLMSMFCVCRFVENFSLCMIENATHWVQQDAPEIVNKKIRDFVGVPEFTRLRKVSLPQLLATKAYASAVGNIQYWMNGSCWLVFLSAFKWGPMFNKILDRRSPIA